MSSTELQTFFDSDYYVGLDGLTYSALTKARYFPPAGYEQPVGEIDCGFKKSVIIDHYQSHLSWWGQQTAGNPHSEMVIVESIKHYEDLISQMLQADPADPENQDWIETEYRRIDAENQDTV